MRLRELDWKGTLFVLFLSVLILFGFHVMTAPIFAKIQYSIGHKDNPLFQTNCIILGQCELPDGDNWFRVRISDSEVLETRLSDNEVCFISAVVKRMTRVKELLPVQSFPGYKNQRLERLIERGYFNKK